MRLTRTKRKELAQGINFLTDLQQQLHDAQIYNDFEKAEELWQRIAVAHAFLIGELQVLVNEPDKLI